jgi:hypothetical protein
MLACSTTRSQAPAGASGPAGGVLKFGWPDRAGMSVSHTRIPLRLPVVACARADGCCTHCVWPAARLTGFAAT